MNIVEAYIKFNGQLVLYITGLSGCGKIQLAKRIQQNFRIHLIKQMDYYKKDYDTKITLPTGTKVVNWYTDDAFDWDRLNRDIETVKSEGVVVVGFALPDDKMVVKPDYFILLKIPKKVSIDKRKEFIIKHKDKYPEEYKQIDTIKLKINRIIFPYYLDAVKRSTINKYISVADKDKNEVWDEVWELLIGMIQKFLNEFNKNKYFEWKKKHTTEQLHKQEPKKKLDDTVDVKEIDTVTVDEDDDLDEYKQELLSDTSVSDASDADIDVPADDVVINEDSANSEGESTEIIDDSANSEGESTEIIDDSANSEGESTEIIDDSDNTVNTDVVEIGDSDDVVNVTDPVTDDESSDDDIVYEEDSDDVIDD